MIRFIRAIIALVILLDTCPLAFAAASINVITYSVSVSFADAQVPGIVHNGLERISSVTCYAVIKGTATDNAGLQSVSVIYYYEGETTASTETVTLNGEVSSEFTVKLPIIKTKRADLHYRIVALDNGGNTACWPETGGYNKVKVNHGGSGKIDRKGGKISLPDGNPDDGETSIEFPEGCLDSSSDIEISEIEPDSEELPPAGLPAASARPVAAFRFEPSGMKFLKMAKINLLFMDTDKDGMVDGTQYSVESLRVMWWDGFEWRLLATSLDEKLNLASAKIKHFSYYAVFPVGALTDDDYRPKEKIITPASIDGYNDFAVFGAVSAADTVNIYDVTGLRVRQLKGDNTWDGKDEGNEIVESGIYIYQIKLSNKVISGTIVVAK